MLNIPQPNYSIENEAAETATKSFAVILQKAYEQYQKLWSKYLDLIKKYEVNSSVLHNKTQETWSEGNALKTMHTFLEDIELVNKSNEKENQLPTEEVIGNKKNDPSFIDDLSEGSLFDLMVNIDDTIYQSQSNTTNVILPESPIFMRNNDKSNNSERDVSKNNVDKNILDRTNTEDKLDNEKENVNENACGITVPEENLDNLSPFIVQSTPVINYKFHKKNRKKFVKKACREGLIDNKISPEKKELKENKIPLQILDNTATSSRISLIRDNDDQTNNKIDNNKYTFYKSYPTSNDAKLRQTKLPFYNTKNKGNNITVTSNNDNVPITKFKRFLFNNESPAKDIVKDNKTMNDEKIDVIHLEDGNDNNETIFEDVIANSPDYKQAQLQDKNRLKLKRKSKMINTIKGSTTSTNNSIQMENNVCSIKKRNIAINDNVLPSEIVTDSTKKKCLIFSKDIESDGKLVNKNNSKRNAHIKEKKFNNQNESNEFQCTLGNDTYFEEKTPEKNITYKNKVINKNSLRLENTDINAVKSIDTDKSTKKSIETKNKQCYSCWECNEYYKNEAGISNAEMQKRKNQCSRHKNAYYARSATPPGFWDPTFPATVPDNMQQ